MTTLFAASITLWNLHSLTCLSGLLYLIFRPFNSISKGLPNLSPFHWSRKSHLNTDKIMKMGESKNYSPTCSSPLTRPSPCVVSSDCSGPRVCWPCPRWGMVSIPHWQTGTGQTRWTCHLADPPTCRAWNCQGRSSCRWSHTCLWQSGTRWCSWSELLREHSHLQDFLKIRISFIDGFFKTLQTYL